MFREFVGGVLEGTQKNEELMMLLEERLAILDRRTDRALGFADGEAKGFADGEAKGFADGEAKGFADGSTSIITGLVNDGLLTLEEGAKRLSITVDALKNLL